MVSSCLVLKSVIGHYTRKTDKIKAETYSCRDKTQSRRRAQRYRLREAKCLMGASSAVMGFENILKLYDVETRPLRYRNSQMLTESIDKFLQS